MQSHRRHARRTALAFLTVFTILLVWPMLCNFLLEFFQWSALGFPSVHLSDQLPIFLLGSAVLGLLMILLLAAIGRLWWAAGILITVICAVGVVNSEKIRLRFEPLYPGDLSLANQTGSLASMVGWKHVAADLLFVGLFMSVTFLLARIVGEPFSHVRRTERPRLWASLLTLRLMAVVLCLFAMTSLWHFSSPGNPVRHLYLAAGARWDGDSQARNYFQDGFVGGTLANIDVRAMRTPADYNANTMHAIARRYASEARRRNRSRNPRALDGVNVVMILSESFADPTRLKGVEVPMDPIPFVHNLTARTTSGNMLAQDIGGGTANMEFEALAGMSMSQFAPGLTYPYSMLVAGKDKFPSSVGYFTALGHEAVAIHPYKPSFYSRDRVYPALGFKTFVDGSRMRFRQRLGHNPYISDKSTFREVERQIATHDAPLLINLVTMQNHFPWGASYPSPFPVKRLKGGASKQAGDYLRGINYTDRALERFIDSLKRSPEKTVVLFYGDHQPLFWPESVQSASGARRMHQTPFFVWSNFSRLPARDLPTTSPIFFVPILLNSLGAPLPPYYTLLSDLEEQLPAMERGIRIDSSDHVVTNEPLRPRTRQLLHDYRLVQYDLAVGKGYVRNGMFALRR